jgi:DnaJ-class molecular chaperone
MIHRDDLPIPELANIEDMRVACRVFSEGLKACETCNGTGNQLFSMYQCCETCGGSGVDQDGHSHYVAQVKAA